VLPASALIAWQIRDSITAVVAAGLLFGLAQLPFVTPSVLAVACLFALTPSAIEILFLNRARHRRYRLHVYPERLVICQGWAFRHMVTFPLGSILNLRLRQGPVLRRLGLTSVSIVTIADHKTIGPLDAEQVGLIESFVKGDLRDVLAQ
jgi:membrane protein YdbS with pleckstrin-like domain